MSGKIFVAVVAAAVSSASAATVGVVYKKIVEPNHVEASVSVTETPPSGGAVRSAVVLNASDSLFGFFVGSTSESDTLADPTSETDPRTCRGSVGCVVVARASDRRVNILGSAAAIPPIWLGGDSRDSYADRAEQDMLSELTDPAKIVVRVGHRRLKTGTLGFEPQTDEGLADSGTVDPSGSEHQNSTGAIDSGGSSPTSTSSGFGDPIEIDVQTSPLLALGSVQPSVDNVSWPADPLTTYSPDTAPNLTPSIGYSADPPPWQPPAPDITPMTTVTPPSFDITSPNSTVPEPSTWVMMIAGLATLGLFKWRRFAAALKAMRG